MITVISYFDLDNSMPTTGLCLSFSSGLAILAAFVTPETDAPIAFLVLRVSCVLFVCCIHHRIICIASALRCRHVLKLASPRSGRAPLASADPSETNLVLRFPSCLNRSPSLHSASPPRARPKFVPNPNRTFVTVGSGSSPNIYKTSPFSLLDAHSLFFSTVDFDRRD